MFRALTVKRTGNGADSANRRTISAEPSLDASSNTINSSGLRVWLNRDCNWSGKCFSPLQVHRAIEIRKGVDIVKAG